jgi:hypothetical protein
LTEATNVIEGGMKRIVTILLAFDEWVPNRCSKKDDIYRYENRYKIIVGSATDRRDFLLYCIADGFPREDNKGIL